MPRAHTKAELLAFGEAEYKRLQAELEQWSDEQLHSLTVHDDRTAKDVLAHLVDWQQLMFGWLDEADAGRSPAIPAEGYSFKQLPELNQRLFERSRHKPLATVREQLAQSHARALALIAAYDADALEDNRRLPWKGTANLASYFASITSSHYVWAIDLLRKARRRANGPVREQTRGR